VFAPYSSTDLCGSNPEKSFLEFPLVPTYGFQPKVWTAVSLTKIHQALVTKKNNGNCSQAALSIETTLHSF
jgi:hypothetical protein